MRAFIYLRVSTTTQEKDGAGLDVQMDVCMEYCQQHNLEVVGVFQDAWTGDEYRERPELSEMRRRMARREADVVVFYALDRLSRNETHQAVLFDEADHLHVQYISATEDLDNSIQGRILRAVIGGMAELEREKIRARTQGGLRKRVESGLMLTGFKAPYGYRWVEQDGRKVAYIIVEEEAAVVRRIFNAVAQGVSCRQVALALQKEGVPSSGGGMWIGTNLSKVLRNPIYKGDPAAYRYSGYSARTKARKKGLDIDWQMQDGIEIKGGAPAIVDEALWKSANAILDAKPNYRALKPKKHLEDGLLRGGIAVCGYCGFALRHQAERTTWDKRYMKHRHKPREYACSPQNRHRHNCPGGYIYGEVLDNAAWAFVVDLLAKPEVIAERLANRKTEDPTKVELEIVDRQIKERERKIAKIREMLPDLEDDLRQDMIADANEHSKRRKGLIQEREALLLQRERWERSQHEIDSVTKMLTKMNRFFTTVVTTEQKRRALRLLNVRVRVYKKSHDPHALIEWGIDPAQAEHMTLDLEHRPVAASFGALVTDTTASSGIHYQGANLLRFTHVLLAA